MNGHELFPYLLWKISDLLKEFIVLYLFILFGERFVEKRGYNLFERAWMITIIVLSVLTFLLLSHVHLYR